MKGIVFKEFIELVEEKFGDEVCEQIIEENESELESGGAYTSVGTYDHVEILKLVSSLSRIAKLPISALVKTFGSYLIPVFYKKFPDFFEQENCFEFLKSIDQQIHTEVKKLYPKAELPTFTYEEPSNSELILHYKSARPFADLASGLIEGAVWHYKEDIRIEAQDPEGTDGKARTFILKKAA